MTENDIRHKKRQLRVAGLRHERALSQEVEEMSENLTSTKAKILLIGGGLAISYWVIREIFAKKREPKDGRKKHKGKGKSLTKQTDNEIVNVIKEKVALFLVDLAQDILTEAIKKIDK